MLQKVLVVIVGLVMSVIGALSPDALVASQNQDLGATLGANVADETLASVRATDGSAFARIPVLWVEVDGHRVTEDAWGSGGIDEMRFKVGVKGVEAVALRAGETDVTLHPTDIITVRMFRGDFAYRGLGTNLATIQLQGTVKTTTLREGEVSNKIRTETSGFDLKPATQAPTEPTNGKVAYVVLTTGQRVDTLAVDDGGGRFITEEVTTADEARNEPGNLLAKWVKIDGRLVKEYTWGDGPVSKIEFEPAEGASRTVVVAFNDEPTEVLAGERVVVTDFVGEYLVYQVAGGMLRVRLDGYAASSSTSSTPSPLPLQVGAGAPIARFEMWPRTPRTTDTIQFNDTSGDDGIVVFRQWDFGDNSTSVLPNPTHRFLTPGPHTVTLTVTDNDLQTTTITEEISVRNALPVPDFDFAPKVVTTDTVVAFTDHSFDSDGSLTNWSWDFGDGDVSYTRHPTHRFAHGGGITVTLSVVDDHGERASLSKVVLVRNNPPLAAFTYSPDQPRTIEPILFDGSSSNDSDGTILSYNWTFGDGTRATGSTPSHVYNRSGLYSVSLTVVDDAGDADTITTQVLVRPRPPLADFNWTPHGAPAGTPVTFTSTSFDPDGPILVTQWDFGDGTTTTFGNTATHSFARAGTYAVTLTVTDATLMASNVTRSVTIANAAPAASFTATPNPTYRGILVALTDTSRDIDGDAIASRTWEINGTAVSDQAVFTHNFTSIGDIPVKLTVQDTLGNEGFIIRTVRVLNRAPSVSLSMEPAIPVAGEPVYLNATGTDFDSPGPLHYRWEFGDGNSTVGQNVVYTYPRGEYAPRVIATDSEGAQSTAASTRLRVDYALPTVNFTWAPQFGQVNRPVNFTDHSSSPNGALKSWAWNFGDGSTTATATHPAPSHVFSRSGLFVVSLTVTDVRDRANTLDQAILVNSPPEARFSVSPIGMIPLGGTVVFTDQSVDNDNRIEEWFWDFGDGHNSSIRHPSHPFDSPGAFAVRLTVKDEFGATNTSEPRIINVANNAPLARWRLADPDSPIVMGQPTLFIGGESSHDPDGTPLTSFSWDFGDNTGKTPGANVSHEFPRSGRFTIGLTVSDGSLTSKRDSFSHRIHRVEPNHPIVLDVEAVLPNGEPADLLGVDYDVEVRVPNPGSTTFTRFRNDFAPNGSAIETTIPQANWVHGDVMTVILRTTFLSTPQQQEVILRDESGLGGPIRVRFNVRVPVQASIAADHGDEPFILDELLGPPDNFGADPLYTNPNERFTGTGVLTFADGAPAENVPVDIEARWVPLKTLSGVRNQTSLSDSSVSLLHWCTAGTARSGVGGAFTWELDGSSTCYLNGASLYPVGRWEVRARPQSTLTDNKLSLPRAIYVDPTGGVLLGATLGLA